MLDPVPENPRGILRKDSHRLTSVDDWHHHAPPKRKIHWKDGRSAKENARAWIDAAPGLQPDILRALATCPEIGAINEWSAEPESRVAIDGYRGEPPNIDLLVLADDDRGPLTIAIEAKADETFGYRLRERRRRAARSLERSPRSKALARIDDLARQFGLDQRRVAVLDLRYQLLTVTAAALVAAKRLSADRAVVMLHEFVTPLTSADRRERNADDLDRFLAVAFNWHGHLRAGHIAGPFAINPSPKLYVGKARTTVLASIPEPAPASNPDHP